MVVRWRTGAEALTLGFHVYREVAGKRQRLTAALILAAYGGAGGSHSFLDRRAPRGEVAYWLQAVRLDGSRVWQGTVLARR